MRPSCILIICLVLITAFCLLAQTQWYRGPDKCCFSFFKAQIPVKQVESYHTTHQCMQNGVIFITKARREICTDPTERWVQRLMDSVDTQNSKQMTEGGSSNILVDIHRSKLHEMPRTTSEIEAVTKKESIRMTRPLQKPEETTQIHLKESVSGTTHENSNTESAYFCMQPEGE